MFKKFKAYTDTVKKQIKKMSKKIQNSIQDKDTLKKLGTVIAVLLLIIVTLWLIGVLILSIYRFIDSHMGELTIIAISIGAFFAWLQSGKDQREAKRRKALEEKHKALIPKANAIYDKIARLMVDILRDKSLGSLINLAKPTNEVNVIMEKPEQRIQFKPDYTGYLLTYRIDKLSIVALDNEHLSTVKDVLQGAINQRISVYGINGLCAPKQNTFLHIIGEPSDCHSYITFCLDYDKDSQNDSYMEAPVYSLADDNDYGH